jgi:hypothetical protein
VRLERASGVDPVATGQISPSPYLSPFALPQAQSRSLLPAALLGKSATSAQLVAALVAGDPAQSWSVSANGGQSWTSVAAGVTASFAATADVRWRVQLTPQGGAPARSYGTVWMFRLQ